MSRTAKISAPEPELPTITGLVDPKAQKWIMTTYRGASALLPYADFALNRNQLWTRMAEQGVILVAKIAKASVIEQVEELNEWTPRLIFSRPGWFDGQFVTASGKVYAPPKAKEGLLGFLPDPTKCSRQGSHAQWLSQVAAPLIGHHIPCFAIMACFAAPLLGLVGRPDNFGFELSGAGGKGKSTTQRLMASVVGPAMEKDSGYIATFNMTHAGLEQSMRVHSDMPFIIDEANLFGMGAGGRAEQRRMQDLGRITLTVTRS